MDFDKMNDFDKLQLIIMQDTKIKCTICKKLVQKNQLGIHIRKQHGEEEFRKAILLAKEKGTPDPEIGTLFGISFKQLEKLITERYGINISTLKKPKRIKLWEPKNFNMQTTTIWSFKQRGNWATHDGRYRGNWSPYIPRNIILRYSKPGDIVLDYFVGGGTTAVEAKLLGRRCIARDINPACVGLTKENINFSLPPSLFNKYTIYEPEVLVGDARDLSNIPTESIDLICAHPPYAGIINYSSKVEGDLSKLGIDAFLKEMKKVAQESYRVLKPGNKCAILIGDTRKKKHVVPIGFKTINVFLEAGFRLKELVIKRQHNCKTTGFWTEKSIKYNFLLLAHEYLPIFEKPSKNLSQTKLVFPSTNIKITTKALTPQLSTNYELEGTSVWIFLANEYSIYIDSNVIGRYSKKNNYLVISLDKETRERKMKPQAYDNKDLLFIKSPLLESNDLTYTTVTQYLHKLKDVVKKNSVSITKGGFIVLLTMDVRIEGYIQPLAKRIIDMLDSESNIWLKEIVVLTTNNFWAGKRDKELTIAHQYLLVYERV
jgi:DNA modification methylase